MNHNYEEIDYKTAFESLKTILSHDFFTAVTICIEKQIAKKPVTRYIQGSELEKLFGFSPDVFPEIKLCDAEVELCPSCNHSINTYDRYCKECGQRLMMETERTV